MSNFFCRNRIVLHSGRSMFLILAHNCHKANNFQTSDNLMWVKRMSITKLSYIYPIWYTALITIEWNTHATASALCLWWFCTSTTSIKALTFPTCTHPSFIMPRPTTIHPVRFSRVKFWDRLGLVTSVAAAKCWVTIIHTSHRNYHRINTAFMYYI